jgi:AcrR family transcriptional regulator
MAKSIDHDQQREIFAAAALEVIVKEGVAGLTVRRVSEEAGYTTGALTHYFKSKDQLLLAASELSARQVREEMARVESIVPAVEAIRQVVAIALPLKRGHRWRGWIGFWERSSYDDQVARTMRLRYVEWRQRLMRLLRRAQKEGDVAPAVDIRKAAEALVVLVDGIGVEVTLGVQNIPPARQKAMFELWLETVRVNPIVEAAAVKSGRKSTIAKPTRKAEAKAERQSTPAKAASARRSAPLRPNVP